MFLNRSLGFLVYVALVNTACHRNSTARERKEVELSRTVPTVSIPNSPQFALVWGNDKHGPISIWTEWQDSNLRVLGKRSGAIVYNEGGVYIWRDTESVRQAIKDCSKVVDDFANPSVKRSLHNTKDIVVSGAVMHRLDAHGDLKVVEIENLENVESFENQVSVEGGVGPYLFVRTNSSEYHCGGAHPIENSELWAIRLGVREHVKIPSEPEVNAFRQRAMQLHARELQDCIDANRSTMDPPEPRALNEGYGLDSLIPRWTLKQGLAFHLVFLTQGDRIQGARLCETDVDLVPQVLAPYPPPAALPDLSKQFPELEVHGWSVLPPGDAARVPTITRVLAMSDTIDDEQHQ
jgi:hypothetical protein